MSRPRVTPTAFRQVVGYFATGVTVVTTIFDGQPYGMTVSAFCSVSLDPLLVLASLHESSQTLALIRQSGCFSVNVLAAQQQPLAQRFARKDRLSRIFHDIPHHRGTLDVALFDEALARLECQVVGAYPGGDHTLLLGEVSGVEWSADAQASEPLLFYRSTFCGVQPEPLSAGELARSEDG